MSIINFDHLVKIYLNRIYKKIGFDEYVKHNAGYKFDFVNHFQNNFDLDAENLTEMLDNALQNNNLTGGNYFFAKDMLLKFSQIDSVKVKHALELLFNQAEDVEKRINDFELNFDSMMARENEKNKENKKSFIDLRFISLLLAAMYPNDYYYMMISPYRRIGKIFEIGLNYNSRETTGYNYKALSYVGDYVKVKIKQYPEVMKIGEAFVDPRNRDHYSKMFTDDNYNWLTQDFIFITAHELAKSKDPILE